MKVWKLKAAHQGAERQRKLYNYFIRNTHFYLAKHGWVYLFPQSCRNKF